MLGVPDRLLGCLWYSQERIADHNGRYSAFLNLQEYWHKSGELRVRLRPYIEDGFNAFYDYPLYYTMVEVFAKNQSLMQLPARLQ